MTMSWAMFWQVEVADRWPNWTPTPTEVADWKCAFGNLNQEWLGFAMMRVRETYAADVPKIKWVKEMFAEVKDALSEPAARTDPFTPAVIEQMRDELRSVMDQPISPYPPGIGDPIHLIHDEAGNYIDGNRSPNPDHWSSDKIRRMHYQATRRTEFRDALLVHREFPR